MKPGLGSGALALALGVSIALALGKYGFGLYTGSLLLLASAADSFSDAVVSGINLWGYKWARTPPDREHPFGHGKLEGVLATGQGALLIGISAALFGSAIKVLIEGAVLPRTELAAVVLGLSTASAALLTVVLSRAARHDASLVIKSDAAHYKVDLIAGGAGVASMLAIGFTGWAWLDPVASIAAALWMMNEGVAVIRTGIAEVLDVALPKELCDSIEGILARRRREVVEFHGLRTRRSGPVSFIEVHAVLDPKLSLSEVHRFCQSLSREIREAVPGSRVMVHPDAAGLRDEIDVALEAQPRGQDAS